MNNEQKLYEVHVYGPATQTDSTDRGSGIYFGTPEQVVKAAKLEHNRNNDPLDSLYVSMRHIDGA